MAFACLSCFASHFSLRRLRHAAFDYFIIISFISISPPLAADCRVSMPFTPSHAISFYSFHYFAIDAAFIFITPWRCRLSVAALPAAAAIAAIDAIAQIFSFSPLPPLFSPLRHCRHCWYCWAAIDYWVRDHCHFHWIHYWFWLFLSPPGFRRHIFTPAYASWCRRCCLFSFFSRWAGFLYYAIDYWRHYWLIFSLIAALRHWYAWLHCHYWAATLIAAIAGAILPFSLTLRHCWLFSMPMTVISPFRHCFDFDLRRHDTLMPSFHADD